MQRLHRTVGFLSGSAKLAVLREFTGRAIRPHIASRISNVLKVQSVKPPLDRDEIGYAPIRGNPRAEKLDSVATAYRSAIPMAPGRE